MIQPNQVTLESWDFLNRVHGTLLCIRSIFVSRLYTIFHLFFPSGSRILCVIWHVIITSFPLFPSYISKKCATRDTKENWRPRIDEKWRREGDASSSFVYFLISPFFPLPISHVKKVSFIQRVCMYLLGWLKLYTSSSFVRSFSNY